MYHLKAVVDFNAHQCCIDGSALGDSRVMGTHEVTEGELETEGRGERHRAPVCGCGCRCTCTCACA